MFKITLAFISSASYPHAVIVIFYTRQAVAAHLLELELRVDPHVADFTVEGTFLSVGVCGETPSLLWAEFET